MGTLTTSFNRGLSGSSWVTTHLYMMFLVTGALCAFTGSDGQHEESSIALHFRIDQAKELLGDRYPASVVRQTEVKAQNVRDFLAAKLEKSLPEKHQADASKIASIIIEESSRNQFDPMLVLAVMAHESRFNPNAIGSFGEIGLMQVKPKTAKWIANKSSFTWTGKESLKDPATNIKLGVAYLSYLRKTLRSEGPHYLAAYNMGANNLRKALRKQVVPQTYSSLVMGKYISFYSEWIEGQLRVDPSHANSRIMAEL